MKDCLAFLVEEPWWPVLLFLVYAFLAYLVLKVILKQDDKGGWWHGE